MIRKASAKVAKRLDCGVFSTALPGDANESTAKAGALHTLTRLRHHLDLKSTVGRSGGLL